MPFACLIISANEVTTPYPVYPLGAACIVGALRQRGYAVRHFDMLADGGRTELERLLRSEKYRFIGISIRNLDAEDSSVASDYLESPRYISTLVRQIQPDAALVLGGPAFSIMPEKLMEYLGADYGIAGEGEELAVWLADRIAVGTFPEKKIFRSKKEKTPSLTIEMSPSTVEYYTRWGGMLNLQTKRGCPYGCKYCSYPQIEGRRFRFRDPGEVAQEALRMQQEGARYLFFADSVFNDPQGRYLQVAEAFIRHGLKVPWAAFFRPQRLTAEGLALLKRSGLAAIELGSDAATNEVLAGLGKGFTMEDVFASHRLIRDSGIPCAHFITFGGPEETEQTVIEGLKNIEQLDGSVVFVFVGLRILPNTGIHACAVAEGLLGEEENLLTPKYYFSPHVEHDFIDKAVRQSFAGRIDRIYPCSGFQGQMTMLHKMGHIGPLWDLLLRKKKR